ncbi:MAG: hypothetical protein JO166_10155 [Deltaproteobacteria bacterium]|nr:hypothetical protein [Deltaproteobacteria bacterium]
MTADSLDNAAPMPISQPSTVQPKKRDPSDPMGWELPVVCKDCDKEFNVPYRHFQAGVVFHCRHCHGSYVPTLPMYRRVRDTFETFFARLRHQREQRAHAAGDPAGSDAALERELAEFQKTLERLARELRPAGKLVRRKGLSAMFT